jgi:recombination protein RecT
MTNNDIKISLSKMAPEFKLALPEHIPIKRWIRIAQTAVSNNANLMSVNRASLYSAFMQCAEDGLYPNGKESVITIFGDRAVYIPMVQGILKKLKLSGEVSSISVNIVHEGDIFDYYTDQNGEYLVHRGVLNDEPGKPTHGFCILRTKDSDKYIEVMRYSEIEKVRNRANRTKGPWVDWWDEMAKKTVIKRLLKRFPTTSDIENLLRRDDELYMETEPTPEMSGKTSRIEEIVDNKKNNHKEQETS